jgi:peptide/nickel transport system substrate-binding protein
LIVGITEASGNFNPLYYSSAYDGYVVDMVSKHLQTETLKVNTNRR